MFKIRKSERIRLNDALNNLRKIIVNPEVLARESAMVHLDEWRGGDLLVSTNPKRHHCDTDVFVLVTNIKPILWLLLQLKELFEGYIDYSNKYDFYMILGRTINTIISNRGEKTSDILLAMVETAKKELRLSAMETIIENIRLEHNEYNIHHKTNWNTLTDRNEFPFTAEELVNSIQRSVSNASNLFAGHKILDLEEDQKTKFTLKSDDKPGRPEEALERFIVAANPEMRNQISISGG